MPADYRRAPEVDDSEDGPEPAEASSPLLEHDEAYLDEKASGSLLSSIANMCNTILGTGMLAQPHAVAAGGVIPGAFTIAFCGVMSGLGLYLLSRCARRVGRTSSFSALSDLTVPSARVWFDLAIALKCGGVSVSYLLIFGSLVPTVLHGFGFSADDHSLWLQRDFWVTVAILILTPIAFLKSFNALRYTSYVALVAVADLVFVVVYKYFSRGPGDQVPGHIDYIRISPALISSLPVCVFSYTCAQNLFPVFNELKNNKQSRMNIVIGSSLGSAMLIYQVIGLLGYLTFGTEVASNIMESYMPSSLITIARLLVSINVLFSYPLQLQPCRTSILKMLQTKPTVETSKLRFNVITSGILLVSFVIALSVTQLEIILAFVGSTGSTAISFILPGLFFIKLHSNTSVSWRGSGATKALAYFLFAYGCIIMVSCLTLNIYELVLPTHRVGRGKHPHAT